MQREQLNYDVVIVGAGAAGLSAAIRLRQLSIKNKTNISVCVLEKGAEVGSHILSGALFDISSLSELFPNWQELSSPVHTKVNEEQLFFLGKKFSIRLPIPKHLQNNANYIISLGDLCRWLEKQAVNLGIEIYSGFTATEILYSEDYSVKGIATGDKGIMQDGQLSKNYQQGIELIAKQTIFAEGCRGFLSEQIIKRYHLDNESDPQTYALGIKELWEIKPEKHNLGKVIHTIGWPLDKLTYGGAFLYHLENNKVAVGSIIGLDYRNPYLSPFNEFQRFKTHKLIQNTFDGARRIAYGARSLTEGGIQSLPKLSFPGGALIGESAGFMDTLRHKGIHGAMKSGILCAESVYVYIYQSDNKQKEVSTYYKNFTQSHLFNDLKKARNIRPSFHFGLFFALAYSALEIYILNGKSPWTFRHKKTDRLSLDTIYRHNRIAYLKPDQKLTFDKISSIHLSCIRHRENQKQHIKIKDIETTISINLEKYDSPEQHYCPAGVYEIIYINNQATLQINSQNCLHCKACDIKDPTHNIIWSHPEGGSGPHYSNM